MALGRHTATNATNQEFLLLFICIVAAGYLSQHGGLTDTGLRGLLFMLSIAGIVVLSIILGYKLYSFHKRQLIRRHRFANVYSKDQLHALQPSDFESYIVEHYQSCGYGVRPVRYSSDGGFAVDIARSGEKAVVLVARHGEPVSEETVRAFAGSFASTHHRGIFITTSDFTPFARKWANDKPVELINGSGLFLMIQNGL